MAVGEVQMKNNLKTIREIYGATQEQIARAVCVNRVTVANWESGASIPSTTNREKLSLFYGISPDFFFDAELTEDAVQMIKDVSEKERKITSESDGKRDKTEEYHKMFEEIDFGKLLDDYMITTKLLLAKADDANLDSLRTALTVNERMGKRLKAIIDIREEEEKETICF